MPGIEILGMSGTFGISHLQLWCNGGKLSGVGFVGFFSFVLVNWIKTTNTVKTNPETNPRINPKTNPRIQLVSLTVKHLPASQAFEACLLFIVRWLVEGDCPTTTDQQSLQTGQGVAV